MRDMQSRGVVKVLAVPTAENISDIMTKVLDRVTFDNFASIIMGMGSDVKRASGIGSTNLSFLGPLLLSLIGKSTRSVRHKCACIVCVNWVVRNGDRCDDCKFSCAVSEHHCSCQPECDGMFCLGGVEDETLASSMGAP